MNGAKIWRLAERAPESFIVKFPEFHSAIAQLLFNRDLVEQGQVDEFFHPDYSTDLHDPFLFVAMRGAVDRLFGAIEKNELIVVYGDYDVDGVSGATILLTTLTRLGAKRLHTHLPHREKEGYGLNSAAVDEFASMGATLLVTVDCGIANREEVQQAKERGMDVIIIDHHHPKETLPPADFIIHCSLPGEPYPFHFLSGGGTAFKVAQALLRSHLQNNDAFEKWLLDLAALATVADMVPLLGENRTLVTYGLRVLNKTSRIGLRCLIEQIGLTQGKLKADDIGWRIAPRLNAAGRMDHANAALELMLATDASEASRLAAAITEQNQQRQRMTETMITQIKEQIGVVSDAVKGVCAVSAAWPVSLLGLAAGRIVDVYNRPVFIMSEREDKVMGSGRGPQGVDLLSILEAIHTQVPLVRWGGHAQACGFSVARNHVESFRHAFDTVTRTMLSGVDLCPRLAVEAVLQLTDISWPLEEALEQFEPFGTGNPTPRFLVPGVSVVSAAMVGNGEKHLKLQLSDQQKIVTKSAIAFGHGPVWGTKLKVGDVIDIACEIEVNEWNGNRELQIIVVDLRYAK